MVSIYNDDFTTPESRMPYFIEVRRCVDGTGCLNTEKNSYPVPVLKMEKIEIVVPDLATVIQILTNTSGINMWFIVTRLVNAGI